MPNWCDNELTVTGKKEALESFKKYADGENRYGVKKALCEDKFIPYPKDWAELDMKADNARKDAVKKRDEAGYDDMTESEKKDWSQKNPDEWVSMKDGFNSGGYQWCIGNWGTKWGFCEVVLTKDEDKKKFYQFSTAWSPPTPLIKKMSEMFPSLRFKLKYWEAGNGFRGELVIVAGEEIIARDFEYAGTRGG